VAASAYELPFDAESFDHVIVRDLLHHLADPQPALDECARVLLKGGRIDVLEPCRYNALIVGHALLVRAERGELRSTPRFIEKQLARHFEVVSRDHHQALPIHRLLFHPDFGAPRLAESAAVCAVVRGIEQTAELLSPRWARAYVHVRGVRR
jgi:SAM-dependent methyltransferase